MKKGNLVKTLIVGGIFAASMFNLNLKVNTDRSSVLDMISLTSTTASAACVETSTGSAGRCLGGSCSSGNNTGSYCTV